jgi:hypothetical protein
MQSQQFDKRAERIEVLERENRRIKRFGLSAMVCLIVVAVVSGAKLTRDKEVVGSKAFLLLDDKDRMRGMMSVDPELGPGLRFFDPDGSRRIDLLIDKDGSPALTLRPTKGGTELAELSILKGTPGLVLSKDGVPQIVAFIGKSQPHLLLHDRKDKPRAELSLGPDGSPSLRLQDGEGKTLFQAPNSK